MRYEWDVEIVQAVDTPEVEAGEILDHRHQSSFADVVRFLNGGHDADVRLDVVLVYDSNDGQRGWAYLKDGKLPTHFVDALNVPIHKVPQRFHAEVR